MNAVQMKKRINLSRVLRSVWLNEGISRIEIANNLGLDKSTITKLIHELLEGNIVNIKAEGAAGKLGGRKPVKLMINKNIAFIAGIEVQPDCCNISIINLEGELTYQETKKINFNSCNLITNILEIINNIEIKLKSSNHFLLGTGVGLGGIVNPDKGIIYQSIPLNITAPLHLSSEISANTDIPVFIENDANCCCWGEITSGKSEKLRNFLYLLSEFREGSSSDFDYRGLAVGMGIVINGKVYHGENFSAGEFKSILWTPSQKSQFSFSDELMSRSEKDDRVFLDVFNELATNIALLINVFNFSRIYLGGAIEEKKNLGIDRILMEKINCNWPYGNNVNCTVRFSSTGKNSVSYGAASLILQKLFAIPEIPEGTLHNYNYNNDMLMKLRELD